MTNPYDPCVANKEINGSQFTIVWHVDDLKLSHKDPKVVDEMVQHLRNLYEELFKWRDKENGSTERKKPGLFGYEFQL